MGNFTLKSKLFFRALLVVNFVAYWWAIVSSWGRFYPKDFSSEMRDIQNVFYALPIDGQISLFVFAVTIALAVAFSVINSRRVHPNSENLSLFSHGTVLLFLAFANIKMAQFGASAGYLVSNLLGFGSMICYIGEPFVFLAEWFFSLDRCKVWAWD